MKIREPHQIKDVKVMDEHGNDYTLRIGWLADVPRVHGLGLRIQLLRFQLKGERSLRKTGFWAATTVAALLLLFIAGWANTNAKTTNLEASGPRIDPFQIMLNAKNLPTQELDLGLHSL
jgi:hypothetical protein